MLKTCLILTVQMRHVVYVRQKVIRLMSESLETEFEDFKRNLLVLRRIEVTCGKLHSNRLRAPGQPPKLLTLVQ